jgi:methylglutaconyl-CoA hydratase
MAENHTSLKLIPLVGGGTVAVLTLARPAQANAFSARMMDEIISYCSDLKDRSDLRALVIGGEGKHFSAGADLDWMKTSSTLTFDENIRDASRLTGMFETLLAVRAPKIAAIQGAVYGGAVGLVACCDFAVAHKDAKFCLSEVKLGLLPAVISPYLYRKISPGQLRRAALTARVMSAAEAKEYGLVEVVTENLKESVLSEVNAVLACAPDAQKNLNMLLDHLRDNSLRQTTETVHAIARARTGSEGQAGLQCFFDKSTQPWIRALAEIL